MTAGYINASAVRIWVDDVRPAPEGYIWCRSVAQTCEKISALRKGGRAIELLDLDHDAGDFACDGGDYIKILDWLEEMNIHDISIRIHSMNPVGVENMRRIIVRNGWAERQ